MLFHFKQEAAWIQGACLVIGASWPVRSWPHALALPWRGKIPSNASTAPLGWAGWAHCCPRDASSQFLSQTVSPDASSDAREQLRSVSFWEEHSSGSRSAGSGSTGALVQLANCLKKVLTPLVWGLRSASFITSVVLIPSDRGGTTLKQFQAHSLLREHMPDYKSTT